ncbi:MAG TPA: type II toxin-antitoxin system VapC family toxin [Thermoanaerobaculia bacterium]|nr:type II toxin-antitoxin system VapC family toxin [Thermoanaerobaculia bacterium]
MILYLDTSSLVKLYVSEEGSDEVWRLVAEASLVATSVLAYPEARSAFARLRREQAVTAREAERLKADLEQDWPRYLALDVGEPVWRRAGDLAERHALRGFDSLHLASFLSLASAGLGEAVRFSAFDERLNVAALAEAGG